MNNPQERAWETLLSRLREARHPACDRLRAATLIPSQDGALHVALHGEGDLDALLEASGDGLLDIAGALDAVAGHPVQVYFHTMNTPVYAPGVGGKAVGIIEIEREIGQQFVAWMRGRGMEPDRHSAPVVYTLLGAFVVTGDGWTFPVSYRDLAVGVTGETARRAVRLLRDAGVVLEAGPFDTSRRRSYRLRGHRLVVVKIPEEAR